MKAQNRFRVVEVRKDGIVEGYEVWRLFKGWRMERWKQQFRWHCYDTIETRTAMVGGEEEAGRWIAAIREAEKLKDRPAKTRTVIVEC